MDEMIDQMIQETCEGGKSQWEPEKTKRGSQPSQWSMLEQSSMTLTEFVGAKKKVAELIRETCSQFSFQKTGGLKVELKRTEDVSYGFKVFFKVKGNDTEIALFYSTLIETIKQEMGDDVSSVTRSRGEHAIIVVFNRPIKVEFFSFLWRFTLLFMVLICLIAYLNGG